MVVTQPSYEIVKACASIGIERPEDSIWVRRGYDELGELLKADERDYCGCGRPRPKLDQFRFTYANGNEVLMRVAQCKACKRVHWNAAPGVVP